MYLSRRTICLFLCVVFGTGQLIPASAAYSPLRVEEADGAPSVTNVKKIIFNGATLTDDNNGQITVYVADSSTLDGLDSSQFLRSDTSDTFTGTELDFIGTSTVDINGNLQIADTDVTFDGASTTFTQTTGAFTLSPAAGSNLNVTLSGAGDFAVSTDDLYIDTSANNIGISTTTPTAMLDINGHSLFGEDGAVTFNETGGLVDFRVESNGDAYALTVNGASDNVGIGIATPLAKLHINGSLMLTDGSQAANLVLTSDANGLATWSTASELLSNGGAFLDTLNDVISDRDSNLFLGNGAGLAHTGDYNTGVGIRALESMVGGDGNVAFGYQAGRDMTTASDNVLIGKVAGNGATSGTGNIFIGNVNGDSVTASNQLNIGDLLFGEFDNGNIGIGVENPGNFKLEVAGNIGPEADSTRDLGSTAIRWANAYIDDLTITNNGSFGNDLDITDDLSVGGNAVITGNVNGATGNFNKMLVTTNINGADLTITNNGSFGNDLVVTDDLSVGGNAVVTGDVNGATGNFNKMLVTTNINGADLTITNNGSFGNDLAITDNLSVGGNAVVTGNVNGATGNFNKMLVTTNINGADLTITNNGSFGDDLVVTDKITAASIKLTTGAGANKVLTSDANGDATWVATSSTDAGTLDGLDSTQFLRSDTDDSYTNGTLTMDAGTTIDINSTTLQIADTDVTFDGASTTFTQTTGAFTLAPAAGSNLNVTLSGAGDFAVSTDDLYVDSSANNVGISTATPTAMLDINGHSLFGEDGAVTFNETGDLVDFRVESNGDAYALTVNGASDNIGIGIATPLAKLHINGSIMITDGSQAANLVLTSDANGLATWSTASDMLTNGGAFLNALNDVISDRDSNLFLGNGAGLAHTGDYNTGVGIRALESMVGGDGNVAFGYQAGRDMTTASDNVLIGKVAGNGATSGTGNIFIGNVNGDSTTASNQLNIGDLLFGQFSNGNIGIGVENPGNFKLELAGNIGPEADSTRDLGSTAIRWANAYIDDLTITNNGSFGNDLAITDDLSVGGNAVITGNVNGATGNFNKMLVTTNINGADLTITNNGSFGNDLVVTDDLSVGGNAVVTGDVNGATGNFNKMLVTTNINGADLTVTNNGSFGNDLAITDNLSVGGNAVVTGNVNGATGNFNKMLVTTNINGADLTITNNGSFGDDLVVTDKITAASIKLTTGAGANKVLTSDANGDATWVATSSTDAGTLDGLDSTQFLRSDTDDSYTNGTLTMDAGTTIDINSTTLQIADTDITFDGASTTFTQTTGAFTLAPASGSNINFSLAGAGDFAVSTDDLYVDTSTNNVGISTATPTAMLDINGHSLFGEDGAVTFNETGVAVDFRVESNGDAYALTVNGASDNVGIGIATPLAKLHINGSLMLTDGSQAANLVLTSDANGLATWSTASELLSNGGAFLNTLNDVISDRDSNLFLGNGAGLNHTGDYNTGVGIRAMESMTSGDGNVAFGYQAGRDMTTASDNVLIGKVAGNGATSGTGNIFIGNVNGDSTTASNQLNIGDLIFGQFSNGNIGIGVENPGNFKLELAGNIGPEADSTRDLGSTAIRWANAYIDDLTITNNGSFGNDISITDDAVIGGDTTVTGNVSTAKLLSSGMVNGTTANFTKILSSGNINGTAITGTTVTLSTGATSDYVLVSDGNGLGTWTDPSSLASSNWTLNGTSLYTDSTTYNVGIGTSSPASKLDVNGAISFKQLVSSGGGGGAPSFRAVSTGSQNSSTTMTINKPTGTVDDDLMIAYIHSTASNNMTTPSGWTLLYSVEIGSRHTRLFYKVASSEGASYDFVTVGSDNKRGFIATYSGVDTSNPIHTSDYEYDASSYNQNTPAITTTIDNTMIVRIISVLDYDGGAMNIPGYTTRASSGDVYKIADLTQASAGVSSGTTYNNCCVSTHEVGYALALAPVSSSSDPEDPANGASLIYMTDGSGSQGLNGDVLMKVTGPSGTTKTFGIIDYSNGAIGSSSTNGIFADVSVDKLISSGVVNGTTANLSKVLSSGVVNGSTANFTSLLASSNINGADLTITNNGSFGDDLVVIDKITAASIKLTTGAGANKVLTSDANGDATWVATSSTDAGTFDGLDSTQFLRSDTSDSYTNGTLTMDAGTTIDINSTTLQIADTDVTFDGASTTFTQTTGAFTLAPATGSNLNVTLSGTGDFAVSTDDLYVDTSANNVGISTATPTAMLDINGHSLFGEDGAVTFNETGVAVDFRVESNGDAYALTVNGASDNVGIGIATPLAKLHINGSIMITDGSQAANLVLTSDANGLATWSTASDMLTNGGAFLNALNDVISDRDSNLFLGNGAGLAHTGDYNTGVGIRALESMVGGDGNVAFGYQAGRDMTTASDNVLIGKVAGNGATSGTGNIFIGNVNGDSVTASNQLNIGDLLFGEFDNGNIGIGVENPGNFKLELGGHTGPTTDSNYDLGSTSLRFRNAFIDDLTITNNGSFGNDLSVIDDAVIGGDTIVTGNVSAAKILSSGVVNGTTANLSKVISSGVVNGTTANFSKILSTGVINGTAITGTTITLTTGATSDYVLVTDANGLGTWTDPSSLASSNWTLNGTNLYPDSTSYNVGIGTITPASILDINGAMTLHQISDSTGGGGGAPVLESQTDDAFVNTASNSVAMPSGTQENDLLVAVILAFNNRTFTSTGWTFLGSDTYNYSGSILDVHVLYKIAGSGESGPYTFTASTGTSQLITILRYSGVDTSNPINAYATNTGASGPITTAAVTTTVDNCKIVKAAIAQSLGDPITLGTLSGYTSLRYNNTTYHDERVYDKDQVSAGTTDTNTMTISEDEGWATITIAIAPSGDPTGLADPGTGQALFYTSNGANANAGDVMIKSNVGGTTKTVKIVDYNNGRLADASTVNGFAASQFLRSDTSDNLTSGTLTLDASTELNAAASSTVDIDGDLEIADTNISFDGASTTFTQTTGTFTIAPAAGSNFNVSLSTTGDFAVNTNGLYLDTSADNVGIGTTSPAAKLQVNGSVMIVDGSQGANKVLTSDANGLASWVATSSTDAGTLDGLDSLQFLRSDTSDTFTGTELDLIGTSTLDINGDLEIADTDITLDGATTTFTQTTGLIALAPAAGSNLNVTLSGTGDFAVSTDDLYVDTSANNVGISTATPTAMLDINGHSLFSEDGAVTFNETGDLVDFRVESNGDAYALTVNGASDNVGIGIATPLAKLHINGSIMITDGSQAANLVLTSDANGLATWSTASELLSNGGAFLNTLNDVISDRDSNLFLGNGAGLNHTGDYNTGVGIRALESMTSGDGNVAFGYQAGRDMTTASNNVLIGKVAGNGATSGTGNIFIGNVNGDSTTASNQLNIGDLIFGQFSNGNIGIGVENPGNFKLELAGDIGPEADSTRDLGSTSLRWNGAFIDDITITNNGSFGNDIDITDDLSVGGNAVITGNVNGATGNFNKMLVTTNINGANLTITNNGSFGDDLVVTDKITAASIQLTTGSTAGYILESDATGVATWVNADTLTAGDANTLDGLDSLDFLKSNGSDSFTSGTLTFSAGTSVDVGAATSFELPNSAAPVVNAAGEIALDTSITNHAPLIKYYSGAEELVMIAMPTTNLTSTDGQAVTYNATSDKFEMTTINSGEWTDTGSVLHPKEETVDNVVIGGTTQGGSDIILNVDGSAVFNEQGSAVNFRVESDTYTNMLFVNGTTNSIGVGTTTPDGILHLDNRTSDTDLVIEKDDTTNGRILFHSVGSVGAMFVFDTNEDIVIENETSDKDIIFKVNDGGTDTELARFDGSTSRFGIGYDAPSTKLAVNGTVFSTGLQLQDGNQSAGYVLTSNASGVGSWAALSSLNPDADTLDSLDSTQFLRSDASDSFTSGTLTMDAGTTIDINSTTLQIADTDITFDGASTTFTQTTGAFTLSPAAGSNLNVSLSGTGDLVVNTEDLYVDTSAGNVGIGTSSPGATLEINGTLAYTASSSTNITAGVGITVTKAIMRVQGNGGAVNITANPQIADGTDGQIIIIKGMSDTNTLTLDDGEGLELNSGASFTLGRRDTISLMYDAVDDIWIEISRSNN